MASVRLDIHVLIWLMGKDRRLGRETRPLADSALRAHSISVSAITFWETAMLQQQGRIELTLPVTVWRRAVFDLGIGEFSLSGDIAAAAAALDEYHPDPADRLIAATAIHQHATLITADQHILRWGGASSRHDARA